MSRRLLVLILFALVATGASGQGQTQDRIVAKVGDGIILESELDEQMALLEMQIQTLAPDSARLQAMRREVLEQMIENKVLLAEARRESLEVKGPELTTAVDRAMADVKSRFARPEEFEKQLRGEGLTEEALRKKYEDDLRERLLVQKLIDKNVRPKVEVSPKEIQEFYKTHRDSIPGEPEQVELSHILVTVKPGEEEVQRATRKLAQALGELKKKASFSAVAEKYSEDPGSSDAGGDLGYIHRGDMVPEFEEAAFGLKADQVSGVIQTRFGLHILKVTDRQDDSVRVSHILVRVHPSDADIQRAKKVAESLRGRVAAGEDFSRIAQSYSDDLDSKDKGGALGFIVVDRLPPAFKEAAAILKEGEMSEVIQTEYGFHIVKLLKRQPARNPTYEEIKDRLSQYVFQRKLEERYEAWLKELKKKIYIQNKLEKRPGQE
jgi:peptidyl-prolyl cis-trans isomerase SurA